MDLHVNHAAPSSGTELNPDAKKKSVDIEGAFLKVQPRRAGSGGFVKVLVRQKRAPVFGSYKEFIGEENVQADPVTHSERCFGLIEQDAAFGRPGARPGIRGK